MMDFYEVLDRAVAEFERRLRLVRDDEWDQPTPCEGWSVRDLVDHVVWANVMAVGLLRGDSREETMAGHGRDHLGDDPLDAFLASVESQRAAFAEPGALERVCAHPLGDIPGWQLLGFRIGDHVIHAWDLARAIGAEEQLDPEVVELVYLGMLPMAEGFEASGIFGAGATGTVPDDAPVQDKLLDLAGRRP